MSQAVKVFGVGLAWDFYIKFQMSNDPSGLAFMFLLFEKNMLTDTAVEYFFPFLKIRWKRNLSAKGFVMSNISGSGGSAFKYIFAGKR